jgi:spermidine dehydrogenase
VIGAPGFKSLGWLGKLADKLLYDDDQPYKATFFPDGNASIARLLVRRMIPDVAAGNTMEDIVTAKFDYSKLDSGSSTTRVRLNSTVVNVEHQDDTTVSVGYITQGDAYRVRAKHVILACYNGIIPHLCPELPKAQKEGLKYGVKTPMVYTNVLLRSGSSFFEAGAKLYTCPNSYFNAVTASPPTHLGQFKPPANPEDSLVLFMGHMPTPSNDGNQSVRDLLRLGRHKLYTTSFETYEQEIRNQLTGMFGAYGFDADRDIEAITVNRWSHGYAYHYFMMHDPEWPEGQKPHEIGRQRYGRISIANSDSEASPYIWAAIESGIRAVDEQMKVSS